MSKSSSHPPSILKKIPEIVSNRLSSLSSSKREFDNTCKPFRDALKAAGHDDKINFENKNVQGGSRRKRKRRVIWWNPPFSLAVQTNLTKLYYKIIERGIPKHGLLHKLFNKTNLRISYSCTENIGAFIARHNSKIMRDYEKTIIPKRLCNCSPANRNNCPLNGQCLLQSLVYRADVTTDRPDEHRFYFGLVSNSFKERYGNHLKSFRHEKYKNETTLSSYFWHLKEKGRSPNIKWSVAKRAPPYNPASKKCRLCLTEKTLILEHASDPHMLNSRTEMFSKCRHRWKHVLAALR